MTKTYYNTRITHYSLLSYGTPYYTVPLSYFPKKKSYTEKNGFLIKNFKVQRTAIFVAESTRKFPKGAAHRNICNKHIGKADKYHGALHLKFL